MYLYITAAAAALNKISEASRPSSAPLCSRDANLVMKLSQREQVDLTPLSCAPTSVATFRGEERNKLLGLVIPDNTFPNIPVESANPER